MRLSKTHFLLAVLMCELIAGCGETTKAFHKTWHEKFGWKAEDYFDDPKVVALCHAIESDDIKEIDRLVADGANVNAKGKDNMTPLLWAFPDNRLERFKRLLELGANPNVVIDSDFNSHGGMLAGDSVTHMACKTAFPGYFEAVFDHGGDPNFIYSAKPFYQAPLIMLIDGAATDKREKVKTLIAKGAKLDTADGESGDGLTPAMDAVAHGQYDVAVELLEAGANPNVYRVLDNQKLIHIVLGDAERREPSWTPQQKSDHQKLIDWLTTHGQSNDEAKADRARWKSWSGASGEYQRKMAVEVAERNAKELDDGSAKTRTTDSGQK